MRNRNRTETYHQRLVVPFEYPVLFTRGAFRKEHEALLKSLTQAASDCRKSRVAICLDDGLATAQPELRGQIEAWFQAHDDRVEMARPILLVPGGERAKNDPGVFRWLVEAFLRAGLCRHSFVMAIGGGAVLDTVGFAAALTHRGLRLIRLPTTTLAQADAGVGVKNGINFDGVKNAIGTFAPPFAVINDFDFLQTLSDKDWIAGVAEAIKVAIVRDRSFFHRLEDLAERLRRREESAMEPVIRTCAALHLAHIRQGRDPFERGAARPLDFGHWAAHALESLSEYRTNHGHAVAFGIRLDTLYAWRRGWLPEPAARAIFSLLDRCGFFSIPPVPLRWDHRTMSTLLEGLDRFREHLGGHLCVTLPREIGRTFETDDIDRRLMAESIRELLGGATRMSRSPVRRRKRAAIQF